MPPLQLAASALAPGLAPAGHLHERLTTRTAAARRDVLRLKRLPAKPPKAAALAPALVGHYRSPDLDTDAHISIHRDNKIAMHFHGAAATFS
jgi:hypothetical protein